MKQRDWRQRALPAFSSISTNSSSIRAAVDSVLEQTGGRFYASPFCLFRKFLAFFGKFGRVCTCVIYV